MGEEGPSRAAVLLGSTGGLWGQETRSHGTNAITLGCHRLDCIDSRQPCPGKKKPTPL
jgi:hypothetical protein